MPCYPVQLLKWDHARFDTLLNYLQGIINHPEPASRDPDELLELYTLLKPAVRGRHQAEEAALRQRLEERQALPAARLKALGKLQSRVSRLGLNLERRIRNAAQNGIKLTASELKPLAQPFINNFRELMVNEEQIYPLLESHSGQLARSDDHRPPRHGIDLNYRARPQE